MRIISDLATGRAIVHEVRLAEDPTTGDLLGVCAFGPRALGLADGVPPIADAAYITVVGVSAQFRGYRLADGRSIGDCLLYDALRVIETRYGGGPMPPVWALIATTNDASHALFERHGFDLLGSAGNGYDIRYRVRTLPIADPPPRPPS